MSHTVHITENPSVTVTEEAVDAQPPDRIAFEAEGVVKMSEALLGQFEGTSLNPVGVGISVDPSRTVDVDLAEEATLRLESVDVGVSTPDADDFERGVESVGSSVRDRRDVPTSGGNGAGDGPSGAIAFTVEGTIRDLSEEQVAAIADGSPTLESVTFSVSEAVETDGGVPDDVLLEVGLFGFGVVVRRDGTVEISAGWATSDVDLF